MTSNKIIQLEELSSVKMANTNPNECNVLTDYHKIVISEAKDHSFVLRVAKFNNRYHFGYDYTYRTGGGSSSPNIGYRAYNDLQSGVKEMLIKFIPLSQYSMYHKDMKEALRKIKQPFKPIQLTLDLF